MNNQRYRSWALPPKQAQRAIVPGWRNDVQFAPHAKSSEAINNTVLPETGSVLPFGNGRSYGDSCLNSAGDLIDTCRLNNIIAFDRINGVLTVESGAVFSDLLQIIVPAGWFLPVTPGTSQITVGGAIANDVHGKNHYKDGTFGCFVANLTLVTSTGVHTCSLNENTDLFRATIGGLGLTGVITSATINLMRIHSSDMNVDTQVFNSLDEFAEMSRPLHESYQYAVAWLDCTANAKSLGRGVFLNANHANEGTLQSNSSQPRLSIPVNFPSRTLNHFSIKAFNQLYFYMQRRNVGKQLQKHYHSYFYPLDAIGQWNRIYGSKGFYQYQFIVPLTELPTMKKILNVIVDSGMGSFLAVLKEFGKVPSPGMLSFPREGYCLALDFAYRAEKTEQLIARIDDMVVDAGGAAYPAKDRLMSAASFKQYFPLLNEFKQHVDPRFASDFWRRVNG